MECFLCNAHLYMVITRSLCTNTITSFHYVRIHFTFSLCFSKHNMLCNRIVSGVNMYIWSYLVMIEFIRFSRSHTFNTFLSQHLTFINTLLACCWDGITKYLVLSRFFNLIKYSNSLPKKKLISNLSAIHNLKKHCTCKLIETDISTAMNRWEYILNRKPFIYIDISLLLNKVFIDL